MREKNVPTSVKVPRVCGRVYTYRETSWKTMVVVCWWWWCVWVTEEEQCGGGGLMLAAAADGDEAGVRKIPGWCARLV